MRYVLRPMVFVCALACAPPGLSDVSDFEAGLNAFHRGSYLEAYYIWKALAADGDPISAYNLAVLYANGLGVERDARKAVVLYRDSADAGHAPAQFNLGMAYLTGDGVDADYKEAARWWVKAAEQKNVQAVFNLATLYTKGMGVKRDDELARGLYQIAADLGDARAAKIIADLGEVQPVEIIADPEDAQVGKTIASRQTQPEIQSDAAAPTGEEIKSQEWILAQPDQNYAVQVFAYTSEARALQNIRRNHLQDDVALFGVNISGRGWYKVLYGSFDRRGDAINARSKMRRLFPQEAPWLRRMSDVKREIRASLIAPAGQPVAEAGSVPGNRHQAEDTSEELQRGQSAFNDQRYGDAYKAWMPLAQNDTVEAQYGIGFMYESGWGVDKDYAEAFQWYDKAARAGHAKSQYNLGILYLDGRGVIKDREKGRYWIQSAANQNDQRAVDFIDSIPVERK